MDSKKSIDSIVIDIPAKKSLVRTLYDSVFSVPKKALALGLSIGAVGFFYFAAPDFALSQTNANGQIDDIASYMDRCPKNNPFYKKLKQDFSIYHIYLNPGYNGNNDYYLPPVKVDFDSIFCSEPASSMNDRDYSAELLNLKALEVAHDMDFGMSGHLP